MLGPSSAALSRHNNRELKQALLLDASIVSSRGLIHWALTLVSYLMKF